MAEPLKYIYNKTFISALYEAVKNVLPQVKQKAFLDAVFISEWDSYELKQRMRHISNVLHQFIDSDYKKGVEQLLSIFQNVKQSPTDTLGFEYMFFPDYIECYGLDYFDESVNAMEEITQFTSCEFAIRPFFIQYPEQTLHKMIEWSKHKHAMVRRLSTEGCRPRLPWAMALPVFKNNPEPILPILERLRNDESESVRRSVANNLNDISKDHPKLVCTIAQKWLGESKHVDWVVKHACRTLLKQGMPELMVLFGYTPVSNLKISSIEIQTPEVNIGDSLAFEFLIKNTSSKPAKVRLEYGMYYKKANGSLSKKVFKISEKDYQPGQEENIVRKQSFKPISTRKFYSGEHEVSLIVNGQEFGSKSFMLKL